MAFGAIVLPGGIAAESDPTALKIAQNLADLNDAATARSNLDLKDLAEVDRAELREVPAASMAADGDVLAADGLGGYAWETPAAAGGGWIRETVSVSMPAPVANDGTGQNLSIDVGSPGPYFVDSFLIEQIGGDYAAGTPNLSLGLFCNPARSIGFRGVEFTFPPSVLPSSWTQPGWGFAALNDDTIYLTLTDNTFTGNTVQYRVFVTLTRPASVTDNT